MASRDLGMARHLKSLAQAPPARLRHIVLPLLTCACRSDGGGVVQTGMPLSAITEVAEIRTRRPPSAFLLQAPR